MIGFTGPVTLTVVPLPSALGVMDPEIDKAVVVKLSGAPGGAGEVDRLLAASAELTRKKYVVFGNSPPSVIECAPTSVESFAFCDNDDEEVPYETTESAGSLVAHVTTADVAAGASYLRSTAGGAAA